MRRHGFSEEDIAQVYSYVPPAVTRSQFLAAFANDLSDADEDAEAGKQTDRGDGR